MKIADISVDLIDHMGSDLSVVNAARVSFDKESDWVVNYIDRYDDQLGHTREMKFRLNQADTKLVRYLAEHNHWSPFSHAFASFRIKAPIFVARQLVKHTVGLAWNEVSRRYVSSEPEFYLPEYWRKSANNVKQGSSDEPVDGNENFKDAAIRYTAQCNSLYNGMIMSGICAEQARMVLPQNLMTEWIWSGSLYAFARVCNLRLDSHTQRETQDVASLISMHMTELFPVSWETLVLGDKNA
jgi:thymidylate synthase (FAD)